MDNLELWNKVGKTTSDTKTKEVSYGARKFTAIDAYSQIKTATSEFGKYGEKWGFSSVDYQVIEGRLYFVGNFFYPNGKFPIMNDCKVGEDASKKVFTDSLTKALSYLGFNADVFMGQFEGNKYTGGNSNNKTENNETEKEWYNDFDKHIEFYKTQIKEGQTAKDIIGKLTQKYKVNKKIRQSIEDLESDNK